MYSFREFIKKGFLSAVGKMADYQIILNSAGYYEKGVLLEEDLEQINTAIQNQYIVEDTIAEENIAYDRQNEENIVNEEEPEETNEESEE